MEKTQRNLAIDAYRGLVMLLMMGEVMEFRRVSMGIPGNAFWSVLAFHQNHVKAGLGNRQGQSRQPGATADIGDPLTGLEKLGHGATIQQVAIPEPVDLVGSHESPCHAEVRQQLRVMLGQAEPVSKYRYRRLRRRGRLRCRPAAGSDMFHVKHSPRPRPRRPTRASRFPKTVIATCGGGGACGVGRLPGTTCFT